MSMGHLILAAVFCAKIWVVSNNISPVDAKIIACDVQGELIGLAFPAVTWRRTVVRWIPGRWRWNRHRSISNKRRRALDGFVDPLVSGSAIGVDQACVAGFVAISTPDCVVDPRPSLRKNEAVVPIGWIAQ